MNDIYLITCAKQAVKIAQYEELIAQLQQASAGKDKMIEQLEKEAEERNEDENDG